MFPEFRCVWLFPGTEICVVKHRPTAGKLKAVCSSWDQTKERELNLGKSTWVGDGGRGRIRPIRELA